MPHPKGGYKTKDGVKCPGVTTIISRFKESGGLIHWAWQQGKDGLDFRETRDSAAEAGTVAHALVEYHITGKSDQDVAKMIEDERIDKEVLLRANQAYENYLNWERMTKLKVVQTEMSLVSERHKFGGTFDGIAVVDVDGVRALADWKTGAIYTEALIQCAAYKGLWEELHPAEPIEGGIHIVSFSREQADFNHRYFSSLDSGWELFLLYRKAFDIDKQLKKRL